MSENIFEFEKPIAELQNKITELEAFSKSSGIDCSDQLDALRGHLETLKKDVYTNLDAWQRIQLSRHPGRPYALDYIERIFNNFIGKRIFAVSSQQQSIFPLCTAWFHQKRYQMITDFQSRTLNTVLTIITADTGSKW